MDRLRRLVGNERPLREVAQALYHEAQGLGATAFGAFHVTCSDETERECAEAFQHGFVDYLLPTLKFSLRSAFRLANLGGRHEWGAARLAEDHFLQDLQGTGTTLMVAKVNSHVACEDGPGDAGARFRLGSWRRYGRRSACCGALDALLGGGHGPHLDELREAIDSEGKDRFAALTDERRVDPALRPLYAALVSARLQARKVVLELQDHEPPAPVFWLIVPSVTINRSDRDTEILCGAYSIDGRQGRREVVYSGLGDDPATYRIAAEKKRLAVTDDQVGRARPGRDHRRLAGAMARRPGQIRVHEVNDRRLERVRRDVAENRHRHHHHAKALLRIALPILADVAPIPAALAAFAQGAADIHHAYRIHRLADEMKGTEEARRILAEIEERIDQLDPAHAEGLLELLVRDHTDHG